MDDDVKFSHHKATPLHQCKERNDDAGIWSQFLAWWLLPAHLLLVALVTSLMLSVVQGRKFLLNTSGGADVVAVGHTSITIYQSDVNTLLSVALVLVRMIAGSWFSLAAFRIAFITLEKTGMSWDETQRLLVFGIPTHPFHRKRVRASREATHTDLALPAVTWLIFLLAIPAQLAAPLAAGSLAWSPVTEASSSTSEVAITSAGVSPWWGWFNAFQVNRLSTVYRAAALAAIAPTSAFNGSATPAFRRQVPSIRGIPLNSTLASVIVPHFEIHSLEWITSEAEIEGIQKDNTLIRTSVTIGDEFEGTLNMSSDANPLSQVQYGQAVIMNEEAWVPVSKNDSGMYPFPASNMVSDTRFVLVLFNRNDGGHILQSCRDISYWFGEPGDLVLMAEGDHDSLNQDGGPAPRNCWAVARLNFTAGVTECTDCPVVADSIVEATPSVANTLTSIPHPLVNISLSMMPDVLEYMSVMNVSQMPTWQNLDGYTRGMMSIAYQASWNSLNNDFQTNDPTNTTATAALQLLVANVDPHRMLTWAALNALMTLSGILLALLQLTCAGKVVRSPSLSALLMDTTALLAGDVDGLCNGTRLSTADGKHRIKLSLSSKHEQYHHPRLVPESDDTVYSPLREYKGGKESF